MFLNWGHVSEVLPLRRRAVDGGRPLPENFSVCDRPWFGFGSREALLCPVLYWYFLNDRHSEQQKSAKGQLGSLMITDIPITSEQLAVLSHFQVRLTAYMWRSWRAADVGWSMMVSSDTDLFGSVAFCGTVTMGQYDQDWPMMANGFWMVLVWQTSIKL